MRLYYVRRLFYKLDGAGWLTDRRAHIFVASLDGGEVSALFTSTTRRSMMRRWPRSAAPRHRAPAAGRVAHQVTGAVSPRCCGCLIGVAGLHFRVPGVKANRE
jgi:hypothetical protein